ncbi:MAG: hypothetical protein HY649_05905 [Acidobacteria bacterium]|nr:hypothetical protein [Acidobacteriota bacterium]
MRCPTCGKKIGRGELACSYCGAMASTDAWQKKPAAEPAAQGAKESSWEAILQQLGQPREQQSEAAEAEEEAAETESAWPLPEAESRVPAPQRRPQPSLLFRLLLPLIFLLIPLFNYLFWDSPANPWSNQKPELEQALFCEGIRDGLPVNAKSVFSLQNDRQVVFHGRWRGSRMAHTFSLRWFTPEGNPYKTTAALRYALGRDEFSTHTALPLEAGMSLGEWRAEVSSDQEVVARLTFQLQE